MSTTEAVKEITIKITNLIFLYINGNINIHHEEKLEFATQEGFSTSNFKYKEKDL